MPSGLASAKMDGLEYSIMGHIVGKDIYRKLGRRLDQSPARTPWTPVFRRLIEELYSPAEAELVVRLPYRKCRRIRINAYLCYSRYILKYFKISTQIGRASCRERV